MSSPEDADVVNDDAAFGEGFFDIAEERSIALHQQCPSASLNDHEVVRLPTMLIRPTIVALAMLASGCGSDLASTVGGETPSSSTATTGPLTDAPPTTQETAPNADPADYAAPSATSPATAEPPAAEPTGCERLTEFDDANWFIVNDGVMGGRSQAQGAIGDGALTWTGTIVTAGGGFSSIRGPVDGEFTGATSLTLRVRTDGRPYELLADDAVDGRGRVTHYAPIQVTGGAWQEVSVSLVDMEARVFGNPVIAEPFAPDLATQVGVILADGIDGDFSFEIDWIDACP